MFYITFIIGFFISGAIMMLVDMAGYVIGAIVFIIGMILAIKRSRRYARKN